MLHIVSDHKNLVKTAILTLKWELRGVVARDSGVDTTVMRMAMPLTCRPPEITSCALSCVNLTSAIGGSDTSWDEAQDSRLERL